MPAAPQHEPNAMPVEAALFAVVADEIAKRVRAGDTPGQSTPANVERAQDPPICERDDGAHQSSRTRAFQPGASHDRTA